VNLRHRIDFKAPKRPTGQMLRLKNAGGDPLTLREQGPWSRSRHPKLETRKMLWIPVLTLPVTIGALEVTIGFFGMFLQLLSHEIPGI